MVNSAATLIRTLMVVLLLVQLTGCSGWRSDFENPTVQVIGIRPTTSADNYPRFEIDLRVTNPNRSDIKLKGASYSISLDNVEVIQGVASKLPVIPAYGEATFTVGATLSWLQSLRLVTTLANERRDEVSYAMQAKLDTGAFVPDIRVAEEGTISLRNLEAVVNR